MTLPSMHICVSDSADLNYGAPLALVLLLHPSLHRQTRPANMRSGRFASFGILCNIASILLEFSFHELVTLSIYSADPAS
jgi:hypothetical protein